MEVSQRDIRRKCEVAGKKGKRGRAYMKEKKAWRLGVETRSRVNEGKGGYNRSDLFYL